MIWGYPDVGDGNEVSGLLEDGKLVLEVRGLFVEGVSFSRFGMCLLIAVSLLLCFSAFPGFFACLLLLLLLLRLLLLLLFRSFFASLVLCFSGFLFSQASLGKPTQINPKHSETNPT